MSSSYFWGRGRLPLLLSFVLLLSFAVHLSAKNRRYRCIWNNDPATTMTIGWEQYSGSGAMVYFDVTDHGRNAGAYAYRQKVNYSVSFRDMNNQFARLKNLQSNTKYYFIIVDNQGVSQRFWFRTAPNTPFERLSIIAGGDSRNHRTARQNANKLVAKLRPHCVFFGGDMTSRDNSKQWQGWFDDWQLTHTSDGQMIPIVPARGNHEYSNSTIIKLFDAPNKDVAYALTFAGGLLRAYTLNSLIAAGGKQKVWLENDLRKNRNVIWKMAQYHHPIRPHTKHKSDKQKQYNSWSRLFYDYNVNLVVECDAHVCKTTYPIRPTYKGNHDAGFIRDDLRGTVYVGEGCWGAPLRPANDNKAWTRASGSFNQFKWIWVSMDDIQIRTVKTDNADLVGALSEYDIFGMPRNIKIWQPPTGAVVTIQRNSNKNAPPASATDNNTNLNKKSNNKIPSPSNPLPKTRKAPVQNSLPLIFSDFEIIPTNNHIALQWNTISCPSGVKCEVQRSVSGFKSDFQTIAYIDLTEGSTLKGYNFKDEGLENPDTPFAYYRLKGRSVDGRTVFSEVEISMVQALSNFSEVTQGDEWSKYVEYDLNAMSDVYLKVFNEKGKLMTDQAYLAQMIGRHIRKIDTMFYKKGKYLIQIEKKNIRKTEYLWFEIK